MVDQRSISHRARGIRISLLFLSIWRNYLSRWCQFHWNTTGITFGPKIDEQRSEYQFTHILEHYYSGLASVTFRTNRIFIISGNIGTNKDRWNIWTFGIKVYSTSRLLDNKHQILPVHKNFIENISLNKFIVTTKELPSHQAASINELLVSSDNQGIRNWQIRSGSNNTPHYYRRFQIATNSLTAAVPLYCESRNYESHGKGIIWSYQEFTLNLMYLGTFRRKKQKPCIFLNTTKKRTEDGKPARCECQQFSTTSCLTCREAAGDGVEMDLYQMAQKTTSSNRSTNEKCSLPPSFHTCWSAPSNDYNTSDFYNQFDDDFGISTSQSFLPNVLNKLCWCSNAKSLGIHTMHIDIRGAWLPRIYCLLFGVPLIRLGVRSLSGVQVLQWRCWGVLHDDPVGMQTCGRPSYVSLGSVFSSERAVPSTSSWNPFINRSLINTTPRLCMHFAVAIPTDYAHCLCLPGIRASYTIKLSSYTLLLYHTHIASPSMPLGIVCEGLCGWSAGGVYTILVNMIACLWHLIEHDLMMYFISTSRLSHTLSTASTVPSGTVHGCLSGVREGAVHTTPSSAVMWLVMIVLPYPLGGGGQILLFGMDQKPGHNSFWGGRVQFFLGGSFQSFLGGSFFLGGLVQIFYGSDFSRGGRILYLLDEPDQLPVSGQVLLEDVLQLLFTLEDASSEARKDNLNDHLQNTELDLFDRRSTLAELRFEALELAADDGVSLSAEQHRSHVR